MGRTGRVTAVLTLYLLGYGSAGLASPDETDATPVVASPPSAEQVELRLPPDLSFEQNPDSVGRVVFRHTTHVTFAAGQCVTCHIRLFRILHPTRTTAHAEMDAGRSCGACHDGEHAFASTNGDSCLTCHVGSEDPSPTHSSATGQGLSPQGNASGRTEGSITR